jgi:arginase family enzyme
MKDLDIYLSPVRPGVWGNTDEGTQWNNNVNVFVDSIPDLEHAKIAIIGVKETRGSEFDSEDNPTDIDEIRNYLGHLEWFERFPKIVDLGDILAGENLTDTYFALETVVNQLVKKDIIPLILGGSQDLTYAQYKGYESLEQLVNLVNIDYKIDIGEVEDTMNSGNYLSKIIAYQPNFLFNFSNLGYQVYFNSENKLKLIEKMFFEAMRLGELSQQIKYSEPLIRNADLLSFDLKSIKSFYLPGNNLPMPNGLDGEQACQLMWYAGLSDKLSSVGLYGFNNDEKSIGAQLVAQMIWYFTDGFAQRKGDFPKSNVKKYLKYTIQIDEGDHELIFYKSPKSDRWWVEIPYPDGKEARYYRHLIVPCNYEDYQLASNGEMPDIWWHTYQKLI